MSSDKCYAAIDLGTNSCRLLICNQDGKELCKETVSTRLGEGMYKNMAFTSEAIERGVKCFYDFKQIMDRYNIVKCRAIATASCRMAANGEEFIRKVYGESMIRLEVIDAYEEARLNLKGALSHVQGKTKYVVLFDMGGGSTEITLATNTSNPQILHTVSIPWERVILQKLLNWWNIRRKMPVNWHGKSSLTLTLLSAIRHWTIIMRKFAGWQPQAWRCV